MSTATAIPERLRHLVETVPPPETIQQEIVRCRAEISFLRRLAKIASDARKATGGKAVSP